MHLIVRIAEGKMTEIAEIAEIAITILCSQEKSRQVKAELQAMLIKLANITIATKEINVVAR